MTTINEADKVLLGSDEADAVYLGSEKVWPAEPVPTVIPLGPVWDMTSLVGLPVVQVNPWPSTGWATRWEGTVLVITVPALERNDSIFGNYEWSAGLWALWPKTSTVAHVTNPTPVPLDTTGLIKTRYMEFTGGLFANGDTRISSHVYWTPGMDQSGYQTEVGGNADFDKSRGSVIGSDWIKQEPFFETYYLDEQDNFGLPVHAGSWGYYIDIYNYGTLNPGGGELRLDCALNTFQWAKIGTPASMGQDRGTIPVEPDRTPVQDPKPVRISAGGMVESRLIRDSAL